MTAAIGATAFLVRRPVVWRTALALAVTGLIAVEGWFATDPTAVPGPWAVSIPRDARVLELPVDGLEVDIAAQYRAVLGGYRVINGYSGYRPPAYNVVMAQARDREGALLERHRREVSLYVVLHLPAAAPAEAWVAGQPGAERIGAAPGAVVYRLPRR
jgi:hypothetical protein